jgi:hypothetical protein
LVEDNEIYSYLTKNLLLETRRNYPIINRVYEVQGYPKLATYFPNEKLESDDEKKSKQEANNVFDLESFLSINKVEDYGTEPVSNIKSNKTSKKL